MFHGNRLRFNIYLGTEAAVLLGPEALEVKLDASLWAFSQASLVFASAPRLSLSYLNVFMLDTG